MITVCVRACVCVQNIVTEIPETHVRFVEKVRTFNVYSMCLELAFNMF